MAPEVLPRRHSLLMGSCEGRGLETVGTQADMPFPPRGRTESSKITGYFRRLATMFVRGTVYSQKYSGKKQGPFQRKVPALLRTFLSHLPLKK